MSNRFGGSYRNGAYRTTDEGDDFPPGPTPSRARGSPFDSGRSPPAASPRRPRANETNAERQITQVLEHIKSEWPSMIENDCIPVSLALQLLDNSSVGRAHEYDNFKKTHLYLQDSLKGIVHEHHQGFNSSIGTFHKIQGSIQASQKRVRALKESLAASKNSLCASDPELRKLYKSSQMYDDVLQTLNELEDLRTVPDQLEARISEKRFLTAVEVLQNALRKLRKPELDDIGALSDLRSYLASQETALMDILVEELHEHLYLKSPYCQERWQSLAKNQGANNRNYGDSDVITPFHVVLDTLDLEHPVTEDPSKNPEADTSWYIALLAESLNKLGRLESAVDTLNQRLPVELFSVVNETINDVDQRHPSSLRGGSSNTQGLHIYSSRETQMRADVIYDLLWTLYGKFEAIAEGHRVFHEAVRSLARREGAGNSSQLLGSFRELWNLYQNEIRSLLHNYVTTDADIYQSASALRNGPALNGNIDTQRENLFKFSEADQKSVEMSAEYEALDSIIQAAVPGLTSNTRKSQSLGKKASLVGKESRKSALGGIDSKNIPGSYKSLVEPSVFNMSLLLPPTLIFIQRLKAIVPPASDLAASALTSFLDNFLVNVFQPQLDETLGKLSDSVLGEVDSFQQDPSWNIVARRPVFKGTTAFYTIVTAFCRMLGTIPHDQALSALIISQMMRYYERCSAWFKSLVAKAQDTNATSQDLRFSAELATTESEIQDTIQKLWTSDGLDPELIEKEIGLLIMRTNERSLEPSDVIQDRDVISSLCLLYTSMKWLTTKIVGLRHITRHDTDSSQPSMPKDQSRRWTLLNDPSKANGEQEGPVYLPMTQDTVQSFDRIVSSYEELAGTVLLTLHMEIRSRIIQSLHVALSPETAPYVLGDREIKEPDPQILSLNAELIAYDETAVRFLRNREIAFVRTGLGLLINSYLVSNALSVQPMNTRGCERMQLNILVLQQNLKNIEADVDLARASNYYKLFQEGADAIVEKAKRDKEQEANASSIPEAERFSYDELKALIELCYSVQLADPERGVNAAAKRQMGEKVLALSEYMWQT
ncbi:Sec8 exocyst complex component-specific domain-containing protein [Xylaria bambusicola]|uniref:Sec8 exocyst complex component-specific domain-containing protein n=1 Tax=Xylaria bambusicola TaxID=326684 RepID=UPI002008C1CA|nr:Sec8 exocyst complex component-specific domain-containing protein [Xylaria bambusicola]KAI0525699.1 Sec8 exocyst complex component-specific domain-containing protein [Xylaria bambusicola]